MPAKASDNARATPPFGSVGIHGLCIHMLRSGSSLADL